MGLFSGVTRAYRASQILIELKKSRFFIANRNRDYSDIAGFSEKMLKDTWLSGVTIMSLKDSVQSLYGGIDFTENWVIQIKEFINDALKDKKIKVYASKLELTEQDLFKVFLYMVIGTMPNPVIKAGATVLVPLLLFQEADKTFPLFIKIMISEGYLERGADRNELLLVGSVMLAQEIKQQHDVAFGPAYL